MCCFETLPQTGQWTSLKKLYLTPTGSLAWSCLVWRSIICFTVSLHTVLFIWYDIVDACIYFLLWYCICLSRLLWKITLIGRQAEAMSGTCPGRLTLILEHSAVWHHAIIYPIELAINEIYTGNDYAYHISFSFHDSCKPHNLHKFHLKALPYIFNIVSLL